MPAGPRWHRQFFIHSGDLSLRLIQIKAVCRLLAEHAPAEDRPAVMILIVDRDAATRDSLRLLLECEGFTVREYDTAHRFLDEARPVDGDCLIFDEQGERMGATELCEALRHRGMNIATILVTGQLSPVKRERAQAAGYAAILEKPYTVGEMLAAVCLAARSGPPLR
jgi:FixJ family two-component response regulator